MISLGFAAVLSGQRATPERGDCVGGSFSLVFIAFLVSFRKASFSRGLFIAFLVFFRRASFVAWCLSGMRISLVYIAFLVLSGVRVSIVFVAWCLSGMWVSLSYSCWLSRVFPVSLHFPVWVCLAAPAWVVLFAFYSTSNASGSFHEAQPTANRIHCGTLLNYYFRTVQIQQHPWKIK